MKTTKKRFIKCSKCQKFTRYSQNDNTFAPLFFMMGNIGGALRSSDNEKRPPCSNCGYDDKGFEYLYLKTEISDNKEEIIFYTPEGDRIEITNNQ